jgi:23S rRNA (cytidine1920-2'-O)/16S rRNA (cytidine1409-2'-O)-methyltransferase
VSRERLDKLLVNRGLAETRQKAQAIILAGQVFVDRECIDKPGKTVRDNANIEVKAGQPRYVSRGGEKLEGPLKSFDLHVTGATCLDIGASTGGFTDCLLQHGAARVFALDVGKGQLHWKLRSDPRVVVVEGVNARYMEAADLSARFDLVTIDVSFISLAKVLPAVVPVLNPYGLILALVKPQFEVGRGEVGKGGIVRDPAQHEEVLARIRAFAEKTLGLKVRGLVESPVPGMEGNREFFILLAKDLETPSHEIGAISHRSQHLRGALELEHIE